MKKAEDVRMRPVWRVSHVFGDPSAPAQIARSKHQSITRLHQHEFTETVFILGGKGMHLVNDSRQKLEAGDCFVIESGGMHAYQQTHRQDQATRERSRLTPLIFIEADRVWIRRLQPHGADCRFYGPEPPPDACVELIEDGSAAPVRAVDGPPQPVPGGAEAVGLRDFFDLAGESSYLLAARAFQLLHWRRTHRFCGGCGRPLARHATERAMQCVPCATLTYPRINPVVIVRIARDGEILLARRAAGATGFFSLVAGFVEAGETLEQAVGREVAEEVGLRIANVRYFCSQIWPFPNNLMVAFTADYAGGDIRVDGMEIAEAGWFAPGNYPALPGPMSVSRRLIDDFAGRV